MADMKKKMAAALAAVNAYMQEEEQAALLAQMNAVKPVVAVPPLWALAGRQDIMTMRRLIQMKAF